MSDIHAVIREWSGKPFRYGDDCCQFAAAVIEAATGKNPANKYQYKNKNGAYDIVAKHGDLYSLVCSELGEPTNEFNEGDITLQEPQPGYQMVGVVYKSRSVVRTETGLMDWPLCRAKCSWTY